MSGAPTRRPAAGDPLVRVVRLLVGICQALSIEASYALADRIAGLIYRVDRRHRAVAMENKLSGLSTGLR